MLNHTSSSLEKSYKGSNTLRHKMQVLSNNFLQDVETFYDMLASRREIPEPPGITRSLSISSVASSVQSYSSITSTSQAKQFLHDATMFIRRARQAKQKSNVDSRLRFYLHIHQTNPSH
ncbi:hypothetical protein K7432_005146 [Basidiobolus ranarum]|uniref:Uncharacterized protein n=1 Tax=Basidiobolus ranarum TaxID=34480 RepID=A0ABR2WX03_9FUNG